MEPGKVCVWVFVKFVEGFDGDIPDLETGDVDVPRKWL